MRIGQFNRPTPHNVVGAGKRSPDNEFNTGYKKERHREPREFFSKKVPEWERYPETPPDVLMAETAVPPVSAKGKARAER